MNYELVCYDDNGREVLTAGCDVDNRCQAEQIGKSNIGKIFAKRKIVSFEVFCREARIFTNLPSNRKFKND